MYTWDLMMITAYQHWRTAAVCVGLGALYAVYYLRYVVKKPVLACGNPKFQRLLQTCIPSLTKPYWPTFLCFGTHLQTVGHVAFQRFVRKHSYRSEKLNTPDGGEIVLHWLETQSKDDITEPIVVIIPGLTGDSQSIYVKHMVDDVLRVGCRAVVFNQRGFGGAELKTPRTFCAGSTDDIHFVLSHIHQTYPDAPLLANGASIGGIMLLNYLAEYGSRCVPLAGAMTVSVAWDLVESAKSLELPVNSILYNLTLTLNLIKLVKEKGLPFKEHYDMPSVCKSRTLREFDSRLTVKVFGYRDVHHYYSSSSPRGKLSKITVPTLCLNSADDAFSPIHTIPLDEARRSSHVAIAMTSHGGHCGFMKGIFPSGRKTYMSDVFSEYVSAIFNEGKDYLGRD
ncbi:phospholipase ABHD3 [Strongylocentrotus purpuratus]|uniref:Phospholipase ABHD3 n=1 Tax=Strongylocentrotus purpuratus TaxID=7668 RepID=A0A7M7RCL5_STRPU|nr:phospholipase ABHD3 [Strongylocentrotus purpuratus]XP_789299.1 phospholipase ABHD3 [Strongylocentrotus purpuratus]|eukprot:XP_011661854.1 PREDICTED: phospholipase ABHD3 [Strongylocentrotus purpuratus]